MDRLDILSTYLPLFPSMKGEVLKELSDNQKATILYDAIPNYYIKKMKEANTEPIKMNLEELFQLALNIEEASINPGRILRAILEIVRKQKLIPLFLESKGGVREKVIRKIEENIPF
jgi:hypothetical protein